MGVREIFVSFILVPRDPPCVCVLIRTDVCLLTETSACSVFLFCACVYYRINSSVCVHACVCVLCACLCVRLLCDLVANESLRVHLFVVLIFLVLVLSGIYKFPYIYAETNAMGCCL